MPSSPSWSRTLSWLLGGLGFAAASYLIGTWIHQWEQLPSAPSLSYQSLWTLARRIPVDHRVTFALWILATTLLAVSIGHFFHRQLRLATTLETLTVTDDLTSIHNHRYFIRALHQEIARMRRNGRGFSLLLVGLDDFNRYAGTHGRQAGDDVLRLAAGTLRDSVRETDLVARLGETEFVVLALGADPSGATTLAEKIRTQLASVLPVTSCIGLATFGKDGRSANELIEAAGTTMCRTRRAPHLT